MTPADEATALLATAMPGPWHMVRGYEGWDVIAEDGYPVVIDAGLRAQSETAPISLDS